MFYDPMIAKLITWAPTREEAIDAQIAALDRFEIDGLGHNIDFLSALMQHPRFRSGNITTNFIAEEYPDGFARRARRRRRSSARPRRDRRLRRDRAIRTARGAIDGQLNGPLEPPVRLAGPARRDTDHEVALDGDDADGRRRGARRSRRSMRRATALIEASIDGEPLVGADRRRPHWLPADDARRERTSRASCPHMSRRWPGT